MDEPKRFRVKYHIRRATTPIGDAEIPIIADDLEKATRIAREEIWRQNYRVIGYDQIVIDNVEEIQE